MLRLAAFVCFLLGVILEVLHTSLGSFTPLAFGLLGLAFLSLGYFDIGAVVRRRVN